MDHDAWCCRAKFIDKSTTVRDKFSFARPAEILTATCIYCCDFNGSNLWDLYGDRAQQCYRAWNTSVKLAWEVPRSTHTWVVENILSCDLPSARERIMAGYVGFLNRMRKSASWEVQILSEVAGRDASSVTGRNIINIKEEFNVDPRGMTAKEMRKLFKPADVPAGEGWVLEHLRDMLIERQEMLEEGDDSEEFKLLESYIEILATI